MSKNSKIDLFKCGLAAILLKAKLFNGVHPVKYRFAVISLKAKLFNWVNVFRKLNCSKETLAIILTGGMLLAPSFFDLRGQQIEMDLAGDNLAEPSQIEVVNPSPFLKGEGLLVFQDNTLIPMVYHGTLETSLSNRLNPISPTPKVVWQFKTIVTGYSSTPDQTDETPFVTASGTEVREGIVAANFVPLGTKIRLPELYGNKIFVVEDRMHVRKYYLVDIWFPTREEALQFGVKTTLIEVLQD